MRRTWFARLLITSWCVALGLFNIGYKPQSVHADGFSFTSLNDVYRQNFNTLASNGSNNTWTNNSTINNWYATRSDYNANSANPQAGNLVSFGENGTNSSDRALGSISNHATGTIVYGVVLTNNTGRSIPYVAVSYYGEQWRDSDNDNVPQTIGFSYVTGANLGSANLTTGGTNATALNFTSYSNTNTNGSMNGNTEHVLVKSVISLATPLANGQKIMLRWSDADDFGQEDNGLAIDDLTVKLSLAPTAVNWAGSSLSVDRETAAAGDELTYTLKVSDVEGGAYTASAALPDSVSIVAAPGMTVNGNTVSASGTLLGGISQTYHITVRVNAGSSGIISASALITDGTVSREVAAPDVAVLKSLYLPLITH